jgi:hypothetical protein
VAAQGSGPQIMSMTESALPRQEDLFILVKLAPRHQVHVRFATVTTLPATARGRLRPGSIDTGAPLCSIGDRLRFELGVSVVHHRHPALSQASVTEHTMPITTFLDGHSFDPETKRIMGVAFEMTRAALRLDDRSDLNKIVAENIIKLAQEGERDPNELCERTLSLLREQRP